VSALAEHARLHNLYLVDHRWGYTYCALCVSVKAQSHPLSLPIITSQFQTRSPPNGAPKPGAQALLCYVRLILLHPALNDQYYGHENTAKICVRYVIHQFSCANLTCSNKLPSVVQQMTSQMTIMPSLAHFIAYVLHCTKFPLVIAFYALICFHT
jgi:hypothetical protein